MSTFDLVSVSMAAISPAFVLIINVLAVIASTAVAFIWGMVPQQTFNVEPEPEAEIDLQTLEERHLNELLEDEEERAANYDPVDVPYTRPPAPIPPALIDWTAPMPSIELEVAADLELQEELIVHARKPRAISRPNRVVRPNRRPMFTPMKTVIPQAPPEWGIWDQAIGAYAAPWAMGAEIRLAMSGI